MNANDHHYVLLIILNSVLSHHSQRGVAAQWLQPVQNLVNSYYTSAAENHVIPGAGRSVMLSVRLSMGDDEARRLAN